MRKEEAIEAIREEVGRIIGEDAKAVHTQKNNGITYTGITVKWPGNTAMPVVYIDGMADKAADGRISIRDAAEEAARTILSGKDGIRDVGRFACKQYILDNVFPFLANAKMNAGMQGDAPHRDFEDLCVFYRVSIGDCGDDAMASYVVKNGIAERAGVAEKELYDAATKNMRGRYAVMTMREILSTMIGDAGYYDTEPSSERIYVITTGSRMWGASALIDGDCIRGLAERIGCDLYILPSSIHELIAVPADGTYAISAGSLRDMVRGINGTELEPEDILGYEVYRYSRDSGTLCVAQD